MYSAKTNEPIEMPFRVLILVGPRNPVLDGGKMGRILLLNFGDAAFCQITLDTCSFSLTL